MPNAADRVTVDMGPTPPGLPAPQPQARARSAELVARIRAAMGAEGWIDFARFMELALYEPALGYYDTSARFDAEGDFVTAPELSPLFARCLARQVRDVLVALDGAAVLEAGAGSGRLAAGLLAELERLGASPQAYLILERSSAQRAAQAERLGRLARRLRDRVQWIDRLPSAGFRGVILANELLDALPVQRFRLGRDGPARLGVTWRDGRFAWHEAPMPTALGRTIAARLDAGRLCLGYTSEIGVQAEAWVQQAGACLQAGLLLLIDYGFPRAEYYHPERRDGTLVCHYRHRVHPDPLVLVGLQDISAHIDFTAIAEAGRRAGLELFGYTSQAAFLLDTGLLELASEAGPAGSRAHLECMQQVKKLTLPHEMGELFKVIALGRGIEGPLAGFRLQDRRGRL